MWVKCFIKWIRECTRDDMRTGVCCSLEGWWASKRSLVDEAGWECRLNWCDTRWWSLRHLSNVSYQLHIFGVCKMNKIKWKCINAWIVVHHSIDSLNFLDCFRGMLETFVIHIRIRKYKREEKNRRDWYERSAPGWRWPGVVRCLGNIVSSGIRVNLVSWTLILQKAIIWRAW